MNKGLLADLVYPELNTTQKLSFLGENFLFWKLKIPFVLTDHQFHHLLELFPSFPMEPTPMSTDAAVQEEDYNFDPAIAVIVGTLDDHLVSEYLTEDKHLNRQTAKSIMDSLLTRFENLGCKMSMIMTYKSHRMAVGAHINQHILKMRAMAKELEYAGVSVPDELQAIMLLNSLPMDWEEDVEILLSDLDGGKEELSFDNVSRRLRIIKDIRKLRELNNASKRFKGNCYKCGKQGHYQSDCPDQGSSRNDNASSNYFTFLDASTLTEMSYPEFKTYPKLTYDGSDFFGWKHRLRSVFIHNKVEYVLKDPKPSEPTDSASEEDAQLYKKWQIHDFTCRHLILGALDDDLFLSFHDYPTAKALMGALEACFNTPSTARKLVQLKSYISHQMSDDTPTITHLIKMDCMAFELESSGINIPNEMKSVVLMNSLPESWREILQTLSMQINLDNTLNYRDIWIKLRDIGRYKEGSAKQNKASVSRHQTPSKNYKKIR